MYIEESIPTVHTYSVTPPNCPPLPYFKIPSADTYTKQDNDIEGDGVKESRCRAEERGYERCFESNMWGILCTKN